MKTSVELQEPFSYSRWPIIVLGVVVAGILLYVVISWIYRVIKQRKTSKKVQPIVNNPVDFRKVKQKYCNDLAEIEAELKQGKITVRIAYQKMSGCIRQFIFEMTGIKVHKYTLSEIKTLNMPILTELIQEYYPSEFDSESMGDVTRSLEKTKEVIERWN